MNKITFYISTACFSILSLLFSNVSNAATIVSIANGVWESPATWDCNCIPGQTDDVIVNHTLEVSTSQTLLSVTIENGASVITTGGVFKTLGNFSVNSGGYIRNESNMDVVGNYTNNGEHNLAFELLVTGSNVSISGTGLLSGAKDFVVQGGTKNVLSGSILTKTSGNINLKNNAVLNNSGTLLLPGLKGTSGTIFNNLTGGVLQVSGTLQAGTGFMALDAQAFNNTIRYARTGTFAQSIVQPVNGNYFNLQIEGTNLASVKRLTGSITILGSLTIGTSTFDVGTATQSFDINLKGDWTNNSGNFIHRNRTVTFEGISQAIFDHDTAGFHHLIVESGSFVTAGSTIEVNGNFAVYGTFGTDGFINPDIILRGKLVNEGEVLYANGHVKFVGNSTSQTISGNNSFFNITINNPNGVEVVNGQQQVSNRMNVLQGVFETNNSLTLRSTAFRTAAIGPLLGSAAVSGDVTMQRYHNPTVNGWVHLCSPVSGVTLEDWDDDLITTGYIGSDYPDYFFNNIRYYDETEPGFEDNGLLDVENSSDPIVEGLGYQVFMEPGVKNIDVTGPILSGNINLPVSYTNSNSPLYDGWSLVANPYPSQIDWDNDAAWTRVNMNDAIQVWNANLQQYTAYVNGVSTNGGSRYIASSQSFWVQANGPSPQLTITENAKTTSNAIFKNADGPVSFFKLKVAGNNFTDEAAFRIEEASTFDFDPQLDARKLKGGPSTPNISSLSNDGKELTINSFPSLDESVSIPVKLQVGVSGNYQISAIDVNNLQAVCVQLEDLYTGNVYDLTYGESFQVSMSDTSEAPRFMLHLSKIASVDVVDPLCFGDASGTATVNVLQGEPQNIQWISLNDYSIISGVETTVNYLMAGPYTVDVTTNSEQCAFSSVEFYVNSPSEITADIITTGPGAYNLSDGELEISAFGGTAPYTYEVNGVEGTEFTGLGFGDYEVLIRDSNSCEAIFNASIVCSGTTPVVGFSAPEIVTLENGVAEVSFTNESINADENIWNFGDGNVSNEVNPLYTYTSPGNYVVELTSINGTCHGIASREIEVMATSGLEDLMEMGVQMTGANGNLILWFNGENLNSATVDIFNVTGQLISSNQLKNFGNEQVVLPVKMAEGIALVKILMDNGRYATGKVFIGKK